MLLLISLVLIGAGFIVTLLEVVKLLNYKSNSETNPSMNKVVYIDTYLNSKVERLHKEATSTNDIAQKTILLKRMDEVLERIG